MKSFFTALAALVLFCSTAQAEFVLYTSESAFLQARAPQVTEDFDTDTGDLLVLGDVGTSHKVASGTLVLDAPPGFNVFNLIHSETSFTAFGARIRDIPNNAVFATFVDAAFAHSRLDICDPNLFIGVVSDVPFDLFSFTTDGETFRIDKAFYTLIPEPTSLVFLFVGLCLLVPTFRNRGQL